MAKESILEQIYNKVFALETALHLLYHDVKDTKSAEELLDIMQTSIEKIKELASEKEET